MITVNIEDNLTVKELASINSWVSRNNYDRLLILQPKIKSILDITDLSGITAAIAAAITLVIQLLEKYQNSKYPKITVSKIKNVVEEKLAANGIINFELQQIDGYETLFNKKGFCKILVRDNVSNDYYIVLVNKNMKALTIKTERTSLHSEN